MTAATAQPDPRPFESVLVFGEDARPHGDVASPARPLLTRLWCLRTADVVSAVGVVGSVHLAAGPISALWPVVAVALWCLLAALEPRTTLLRAGVRFGAVAWTASALALTDASSGILLVTTALLAGVGTGMRYATVRVLDHAVPVRTRLLVRGGPAQLDRALAELADASEVEVVATSCAGDATDLARAATAAGAGAVLVLPCEDLSARDLQRLGWSLERTGLRLYVGCGLHDVDAARTSPVRLAGLNAVEVRPARRRGLPELAKSAAERGLAAVALVALSPLLLALAVLVRRDSPGPAFFHQERVGRDGELFSMLKFRTMACGAHAQVAELGRNDADGVLFKLYDDPRVTRIGALLRKYSLDELPQLVNIARGQMCLVGPRPALPQEVAKYDDDPRRRLVVKPGLTGLWQVSGRSDLTWDEAVRLDLAYVDNWSVRLDLAILARTPKAVLGHRGAY